jgi:competence protein ComEC
LNRVSGAPTSNLALKRNTYSVYNGTITHVLAISGQHVAVLAGVIYFALRMLLPAVLSALRTLTTLVLIWVYIVLAGAPPSAIRAGVVATLVLAAGLLGRQVSPVHFMTAMLAIVLAYNPLLLYSSGFQLSIAAVFGILLLRVPLKSLFERTLHKPLGKKPPQYVSNLLSVSLAAQMATTPIVAATFNEVSVIGVFTNLLAVPLSGPILTLGLLGSILGNLFPALAYPLNASNGFLVALLIWSARVASSLPFAALTTPGITTFLVVLYYVGCVPAALSGSVLSGKQAPLWALILILWAFLWLALVSAGGV